MIKLIFALIFATSGFLLSFSAYAHQGQDGDTGLKIGKCYPSYPSGYTVFRKLDNQTYELKGNWMSPNAILKTKMISPKAMDILRKRGPLNLNLKYAGTKKYPMENGFDEEFDLWEDCGTLPPMKYMNREGKEITKEEFDRLNKEYKKQIPE